MYIENELKNGSTVGSLKSPRSRDSISNAIQHRRDRLSESAQFNLNTISCAMVLCFRFFPSCFV